LATVVIGGLLLATLLTLFVLPFLYMKFRPSSPEANESGGTGPHTSPPGDHFPVNGTTAPPFPAAVVWSLLILWALCMPKTLEAQDQQHIDLREALQRATQRWPLLKADSLNLQAKQLQSRAHPMLEPSVWGTEWGQINSVLRDQAVLWSQSMRWPSYYGRQQQVSKVREEGARLQLVQTKSQMELRLRDIFQHYLCQNARYSLLKHNDSILEVTVKILEFRESKGLVSTSDLQQIVLIRGESAVQLTGLLHELQSTLQEVQWMTGVPRIPFSSDSNLLWTEGLADTLTIRESPGLSLLRNNWQEAEATYRVGQAQRWPGLNLGLRNMTIQGMGPDGVVYPPSRRFNTLQIGLMLPMLPKNWKLEAQALKSEAAAKSLSLAHGQAQTDLWRSQNQAEIRSLYAQWEQYRTRLIPVADRLQKQADAQLAGGELDLIQWTHTLQRLLQTREQFILLTEQLNRALLRLHFPQFQP
jgi:cobalt-zinc-cadmium resistance protein CzcA